MSTTATAHQPGTKVLRRRQGLGPYLQTIEVVIADGTAESVRVAELGDDAPLVALDAWAMNWLRSPERVENGPPALPEILRQSLAYLVKCATDMARLNREEPRAGNAFFAIQAELMLDSAVGMALLLEMRKAGSDLVALGAVNDARLLTKFQGRLRETVRELKKCIIESNRGRDADLMQHFTDEAHPATPVVDSGDDPRAPQSGPLPAGLVEAAAAGLGELGAPSLGDARPGTPGEAAGAARRPAGRPARPVVSAPPATAVRRSGRRTDVLVVLVGAAALLWIGMRAVPALTHRAPRILARPDFSATAPIARVVARPPSVYAVVDAAAWTALDEGQQLRLIDSMGGVLQRYGYWGLIVRTPDGKPAGRWLEGRGSALLHVAPTFQIAEPPEEEHFDRFVP